ncbi:MAG: hypothetical protein F6K30_13040 [Cyanothece sp. SIO2G6]|nr:hypothetical protein [Cyanothece sp. SIO2G6]
MKHRFVALLTAVTLLGLPSLTSVVAASARALPFPEDIEVVAEFPREHPPGNIAVTPDGRLIMSQHQVYGTDFKVVEVLPDGSIQYQDDALSWTDGFGFGPDNHIYVTVNQLQRSPALNQGTDASTLPYYLLRFPALGLGIVGR